MNVVEWLEQVEKLDQLIEAKLAERKRLEELATNISPKPLDGMPYSNTNTVSRKVEDAAINIIMLEHELNKIIDQYIDIKNEVVSILEKLPAREYGVLHRYYIRYMSWEQIAEDMDYSVQHIYRIRKSGLEMLRDVILCSYQK